MTRWWAVAVAVGAACVCVTPALGQGIRSTFVPQWHLGDEWDLTEEWDDKTPDGRPIVRTRRYTFKVLAMVAVSPLVREVHIEAQGDQGAAAENGVGPPNVRGSEPMFRRAHLVFSWSLPDRSDATAERLWLSRLSIRTRDEPPRTIVLDFDAVSPDPYPVLAFGSPLPVDFPVFRITPLSGTRRDEFRPTTRPGVTREPPPVRQVLTDAPRLPEKRIALPMERHRPIEYRLEPLQDPLAVVTQIWDPDYPWCVYERTPVQRLVLTAVRVRQGDPLALIDRAAGLARQLDTPAEAGALWSFRQVLSEAFRASVEKNRDVAGAPQVVRERTRDLLAGFSARGLAGTSARMTADDQALVDTGGITPDGKLERRLVVCVLEAGQWKIASGAQPAVGTRPAKPSG